MENATASASKTRLLFVDDEANVLHGLKRLLRDKRDTWDMEFYDTPEAALAAAREKPFDVIVSDMKMPGMDGARLLAAVRELQPKAVRIILSGFAEREAILRTIGPSHRYLAKPCSYDVLVGTIQDALALHSFVGSPAVRAMISKLTHLPTLPDVYGAILRELESEYASAESLAAKVSADVSVSAQLMKLTNSAYFNLPVKATTVRQAIQALGFENVRSVVLFSGVFEQFRGLKPALATVVEDLAYHSFEMGMLCKRLAESDGCASSVIDHAFCAGLLAHVGTLLIIANEPDRFAAAMAHAENTKISVCAAEEAEFGASHAQLGGYLLGLWGFTDTTVEAVACHHEPRRYGGKGTPVLTYVHVVQHLMRESNVSGRRSMPGSIDEDYLREVGTADKLPIWRARISSMMTEWQHA